MHARSPSLRARRGALLAALLVVGACAEPVGVSVPSEAPEEEATRAVTSAVIREERPVVPLPALPEAPRGLGSMSARIPGTSEVVGGVRLALHEAKVTIHEGVAHTEITEDFRNDTGQVLEGRLLFPLPPEATLDRLALWVGKDLVEGEIVEKNRADRIFRGIVDDSVRPRDPALLDLAAGNRLSLRIYPIAPHGSRRVIFAYDQVLRRSQGRLEYVHPLSLGSERATPIEQLRVAVNGVPQIEARDVIPVADIVVPIEEDPPALALGTAAPPRPATGARSPAARAPAAPESAVIARKVVEAPVGASAFAGDVVLALDVSEGQSAASLAAQMHLADAVIAGLAPEESFVILACDAACASYPAAGRASLTPETRDEARRFLAALEVGGASDPAGALVEASQRLDAGNPGQIILLSDGTATAGELSVATALAHAAPRLSAFDVRVIGVGRSVDDRSLAGLARGLGATYDRMATGDQLARRVAFLADSRREPVDKNPQITLPAGLSDPEPAGATPTRAGEELIVLAHATGPIEGAVSTEAPIPRLWAREQIAQLEERDDEEAGAAITSLSVRHHVLARTTSLLVLENDQMFAEFGIPRTSLRSPDLAGDMPPEAPSPSLHGFHQARAPQVRMGMTTVSGRLPPETIQRIVRQNFGRFRACYQRGLLRNPALAGRVTARFVIDRDGAVAKAGNGGSDLPDAAVIACVVEAFAGLSFPQPEGGIVTVTYPITFSSPTPDQTPPAEPPHTVPISPHWSSSFYWNQISVIDPRRYSPPSEPPPPETSSAIHWAGDDRWLPARPDAARAEAKPAPTTRRGHLEGIRTRLSQGRMEEAYTAATALLLLDPDLPAAREAFAEAAAALGHREEAVQAMAAASALDPRSTSRHLMAARTSLAVGDTTRACAHLRALGELSPKDYAARADTCRAGGLPTLPEPAAGGFEASLSCEGTTCPGIAVITPAGRVLSPWTTGSAGPAAAAGLLQTGIYRTLVVTGEHRGDLTVRALGVAFTAHLSAEDPRRTAVISRLTIPQLHRAPVVRF